MGLRLSIGDETQAVSVRVVPGFPAPFRNVLEGNPTGSLAILAPTSCAGGHGYGALRARVSDRCDRRLWLRYGVIAGTAISGASHGG